MNNFPLFFKLYICIYIYIYIYIYIFKAGQESTFSSFKLFAAKSSDSETLENFLQEVVVLKNLQHPHLLPVVGVCLTASDDPIIVTPFMATEDLKSFIGEPSKVSSCRSNCRSHWPLTLISHIDLTLTSPIDLSHWLLTLTSHIDLSCWSLTLTSHIDLLVINVRGLARSWLRKVPPPSVNYQIKGWWCWWF